MTPIARSARDPEARARRRTALWVERMAGFFQGFTQRLMEAEGLVDIAPHGRASQSSTSRWSREDDAQRAVMGLDKDFAFHTAHEADPWWRLDFEAVQLPDLIVVSNRRGARFQDRAATLRIEASENGQNWQLLHAGRCFFGAEADGEIPLVLALRGRVALRHLRLSLEGESPLHLTAVRILSKRHRTAQDGRGALYVANRTDGFGERLKAIVNALALSAHFDGRFGLEWNEISGSVARSHAIGTAEEIFGAAFLARHEMRVLEQGAPLGEPLRGGKLLADAPVIVPQISINDVEPRLRSTLPPEALSAAFWRIEFSQPLAAAIGDAQRLSLSRDAVGLHLRAGDIVYGRYRFNERYTSKVVPYPIALRFVEAQRAGGRDVVIFGQDAPMCRAIAAATGATFAGDHHDDHEFSVYQAAIFDIVLMSRCARVVAGSSGFSQIAQIVGGFETVDPRDVLPREAAMRTLVAPTPDGLAGIEASALQQAFRCWYAVCFYSDLLETKTQIALLEEAIRHDPRNPFYGIVLAMKLFRQDHLEAADHLLARYADPSFCAEPFGSLKAVVESRYPDGKFALDRHLSVLQAMAQAGSGMAAAICALLHAARGEAAPARRFADLAGSAADGTVLAGQLAQLRSGGGAAGAP